MSTVQELLDLEAQEHYDKNRDIPKVREYNLPNGNSIRALRDPQTGFWSFEMKAGKVPPYMSGFFTRVDLVEQLIARYLTEKQLEGEKPNLSKPEFNKRPTSRDPAPN